MSTARNAHKHIVSHPAPIYRKCILAQQAYGTFLLRVLQADFGCPAVFNTSNEAHSWPSIALHRHAVASFA